MKEIDKGNIIFFASILSVILIFILLAFYKYYLNANYLIFSNINCDPASEQCFVEWCDPEYEECENTEEDAYFYKKLERIARHVPLCDSEDPSCNLTCGPGEENCQQILCDEKRENLECSSSYQNHEF